MLRVNLFLSGLEGNLYDNYLPFYYSWLNESYYDSGDLVIDLIYTLHQGGMCSLQEMVGSGWPR